MRIGQKCVGCDRVMRPARTLLTEWPGTIAHHSRGMCYPCLRAKKQGRRLGPPKARRPECCGRCGRRMRSRGKKVADYPGTVLHGARELCVSCYSAERDGRPVAAVPRDGGVKPCRGCDRPTRPTVRRLADFPGTVPRVRDGFCQRCLNHGVDVPILAMAARVTSQADKREIPGSEYRHDASQCRKCYDRAKKFADVDEPELPRLDPEEDLAMYLRARRARLARKARRDAAVLAAQTRAYALHRAS